MPLYKIPYNRVDMEVNLPDSWEVTTLKRIGKALDYSEIFQLINNPTNSLPIKDLAHNKKTATIVIEDHTRCTPIKDIVNIVINELNSSGISNDNITIIGATAAHRKMTTSDFENKLGQEIVGRVKIISHDAFDQKQLKFVGTTTRGTPVLINKVVAESELKIGVGGIAPHGSVGFGGGAKLILPGVAGYQTIRYNHTEIDQSISVGLSAERPMRIDMEEAAKMISMDFMIGGLIDTDLKLVDLVAGDVVAAHREGAKKAKELYSFPVGSLADVVIACSYPFELDFFQAGKGLFPSVKYVKEGGVILWICSCNEGMGCHHLVQKDEFYRQGLIEGFKEASEKASVIFSSEKLRYEDISKYLPKEVEFVSKPKDAINDIIRLKQGIVNAKILYSAPFTIAC